MAKNNNPGRILKGTKTQPTLKGASGIWTLDEALQYHRANKWPIPNLYQPISNSLRVTNYGGTTTGKWGLRLTGRQSTPTQATWSGWFKRGNISVAGDYWLFGSSLYTTSVTPFPACLEIILKGANGSGNDYTITVAIENGSVSYYTSTAAVLRDSSAWYHLHVVYDSTQATNTNRIKIWLNGVQLTAVNGTPIWPPQGFPIGNTANTLNALYLNSAPTRWFDGQIAETNYIDGYALQPTLFGQFDSNNTWVPIPYTGSYGTNGFYLPFTNAQTSQTLGYDASLNGATTYTADQDPYRGSVVLHLDGNGTAGGQNNTFVDSSINNIAITRYGTPTQGSFSPFPFNTNTTYNSAVHGASIFFANTTSANNYLVTAATSALEFGSNNFTIELWWYPMSTSRQAIYHGSYGADYSVGIDYNSTGSSYTIGIWASSNGTTWTSLISSDSGGNGIGSQPITQNAWNHIVYQRSGTTWQSYINGVLDRNLTGLSGTIPSRSSNGKAIGCWWQTSSMSTATGYISGFNIIVGSAKYSGSFTPTNKPFGTLTNNLINFSEDFNNSGWGKDGGISVTSGYAIAPDGTPNMTLMSRVAGTLSNWGALTWANYVGTGNNVGKTYTFSVWVQAVSGTVSGSIAISDVNYNTSTLAFTATTTAQRVSMSYSGPGGTWNSSGAYIGGGVNLSSIGTSVLVWGAQLEVGSTMTNYTPTPANYSTAPNLLLNFANASVVDTTGSTNIVTYGSSTISNSSRYGSGALSFNGSTDYMTAPQALPFNTSQPFTVECWFNINSLSSISGGPANLWQYGQHSGGNTFYELGIGQGGGSVYVNMYNGSSSSYVAQPTISQQLVINTWYHAALIYTGSVVYVSLNGQLSAGVSYNNNVPLTQTATTFIGVYTSGSSGSSPVAGGTIYYFNGQIDDLRVTKGVARYLTNFTPPARALPIIGGKSFVTQNVNAGVVKSFTTVGTTSWTAPSDVTQVEVLVVGGGGAGPGNDPSPGGGGGGGGVIYNNSYPVTPGQTYAIIVGAGGTGGTAGRNVGTSGSNSQFGNLIAYGGGAGAVDNTAAPTGTFGSGGGGSLSGAVGVGTPGQGFNGGAGSLSSGQASGGGGGAGGVGLPGTNTASANTGTGGAGGPGLQYAISGTPTYYAGGGGGSGFSAAAAGGAGGGGAGGYSAAGTAGTANTGGGGGTGGGPNSSPYYAGGNGGSGIVIIRYTTTAVANISDSTTDNLVDSPTLYGHDFGNGGEVVGNYCTLNSVVPNANSTVTLQNGNLTAYSSGSSQSGGAIGTIGVSSGKWYWECVNTINTTGNNYAPAFGISNTSTLTLGINTNSTNQQYFLFGNGNLQTLSSQITSYGPTFTIGDIIGIALDLVNNLLTFYKNGVAGTPYSIPAGTYWPWYAQNTNASGTVSSSFNFGQRAWQYTPPSGFSALTTKNLPRPTGAAATPNQYFDAVLYTGTGSSLSVQTPSGFQPDLVWIKNRSAVSTPIIVDSVRGASNVLVTNGQSAEQSLPSYVSSFNSNGFTIGTGSGGSQVDVNTSTNNYVAWCWRAGNGTVSNNSGTITSTVSVNTASGFSIVTYTGNGSSTATVGHGLGTAPAMIIHSARSTSTSWFINHIGIPNAWIQLYTTAASATGGGTNGAIGYQSTNTSSTFTFTAGGSTVNNVNQNGATYVAYCWTQVPGFSQFGSYTGNGSTDGAFVYCGFKPRWIMTKRTDSTGDWLILDTARNPSNPLGEYLAADSSGAGNSSYTIYDILSNGFKLRITTDPNISSSTIIYAAFADKPFGNANGTAR